MKTLTTAFAILIGLTSFAQEVSFVPKWKKGDKRDILIRTESKKNGKKPGEWITESTSFEAELAVTDVQADHYIIQISYKDFYLSMFKKAYDNTENTPKTFDKLDLNFKVKRDGSDADLLNWEDAKKTIEGTLDGAIEGLSKKSSKGNAKVDADSLKAIMAPLTSIWDSKIMMEAMFDTEISAIIAPFKDSFSKDTVKTPQLAVNPFGKSDSDSIPSVHLSWIESQKGNIYEFGVTEDIDMSDFSQMMKDMMKKMMGGFLKLAGDTTSQKYIEGKAKLDAMLDDLEFNVDMVEKFSYDKSTGFVKTYRKEGKTTGSMMGRPIEASGWSEVVFK